VEDDVTAYVEYPNGATGVFVTSTGESPGTNRMETCADRGKVVLEGSAITFRRTVELVNRFLREYPGGFGRPGDWRYQIPVPGGGGAHKEVTRNGVDAIARGTPLIAPGTDGINGVQLANPMVLFTWTDGWVDIPVDEECFCEELQKRVKTSKVKGKSGKALDVSGTF